MSASQSSYDEELERLLFKAKGTKYENSLKVLMQSRANVRQISAANDALLRANIVIDNAKESKINISNLYSSEEKEPVQNVTMTSSESRLSRIDDLSRPKSKSVVLPEKSRSSSPGPMVFSMEKDVETPKSRDSIDKKNDKVITSAEWNAWLSANNQKLAERKARLKELCDKHNATTKPKITNICVKYGEIANQKQINKIVKEDLIVSHDQTQAYATTSKNRSRSSSPVMDPRLISRINKLTVFERLSIRGAKDAQKQRNVYTTESTKKKAIKSFHDTRSPRSVSPSIKTKSIVPDADTASVGNVDAFKNLGRRKSLVVNVPLIPDVPKELPGRRRSVSADGRLMRTINPNRSSIYATSNPSLSPNISMNVFSELGHTPQKSFISLSNLFDSDAAVENTATRRSSVASRRMSSSPSPSTFRRLSVQLIDVKPSEVQIDPGKKRRKSLLDEPEFSEFNLDALVRYIWIGVANPSAATLLEFQNAFSRHDFAVHNLVADEKMRNLMLEFEYLLRMSKLTPQEWFIRSDVRGAIGGTGKLSFLEFRDGINYLCDNINGLSWTDDDLHLILRYMNRAGDDILTRDDLNVAFSKFHKPSELKQTIEGAGVVLPKLKAFLNMKRMRVTDLFNYLDAKNMGKITEEECKNGVKLLLR